MKFFSIILLATFTLVSCGDLVDNTDVTYSRNTLYLYAGSSSVGDPDYAGISTSLFDTVQIPFVEEADSVKENDILQEYSWALSMPQYTDSILDGSLLHDNGTRKAITPGHIAFATAQLMWNQDLENRVKYYQNASHNYLAQAPSVLLYSFDLTARFVGWNESTERIRTVFQHETNLRSIEAIVEDKNVTLTYSSSTPNGKMVISAEKTANGLQLSGRIYRTVYRSNVHSGEFVATAQHQLIVFMSRITSVAIRTSICQVGATTQTHDGADCNPDPSEFFETPICTEALLDAGDVCKTTSTYLHPAMDGSLDVTDNNVFILDPNLPVPSWWSGTDSDHFRLSL